MKKKTAAVACGTVFVVLAGAGALWWFVSGKEAGNETIVYVNTIEQMFGLSGGNGLQNRFAGVVEAKGTHKVEKDYEKTVKEILVEEGQEVSVGTPLFTYDTDQMQEKLEQAKLDMERMQAELTAMKDSISKLEAEKSKAPAEQQASLTLDLQQAQLDLKKKEFEEISKKKEIERLEADMTNTTVVSEISGVVKSIQKDGSQNNGYGNEDSAFITILETGTFRVKGSINEQNMNSLTEGDRVVVFSRLDSSQTWTGTVSKIDREKAQSNNNYYGGYGEGDTRSSSYPFYIELDNADGLMIGQHVYLQPDSGMTTEKEGLWLPEYFISDTGSTAYVWADNGNDRLEKRYIKLGAYDEYLMEYEIRDGLTAMDAITFPEEGLEEGMKTVRSEDGRLGKEDPDEDPDEDHSDIPDGDYDYSDIPDDEMVIPDYDYDYSDIPDDEMVNPDGNYDYSNIPDGEGPVGRNLPGDGEAAGTESEVGA